MKKVFVFAFLLMFLSPSAWAQSFDQKKLDTYFDTLAAHDKFMGSIAVSKDGEIIYVRTLGYCDVEHNKKPNKNSKYRIGSISKTFTTVLVLQAVEKGKIDPNQTIDTYFPSIENSEQIAVKHLLNHRSGIHNFTNDLNYLDWNTEAKTEEELIAIIAAGGSDFEPDTKAEYSNSNFVLLSYILEKEWGKSYAELLQQYIVEPLDLENTAFGGPIHPGKNECKSYQFRDRLKVQSETDMSIPLGAGGIISTPTDLTIFSDALFDGELLKLESLELMKTMQDNFGYGLFQIPFYEKMGYGHSGGIDGFSSTFAHFEDGDVSYALCSNGANYVINNISIAVLSAIFDKPYEIPTFSTFSIAADSLDQYVGVYSSEQMPLKITIAKDENILTAQGTGQPAFPLEATAEHTFSFEQAGVVLEFDPSEETMILNQGGASFIFTKNSE